MSYESNSLVEWQQQPDIKEPPLAFNGVDDASIVSLDDIG